MWIGLIVLSVMGFLCLGVGLALWKKQKIELIHDYHTRNLKPEDVPAYARLMGFGMMSIGAGILLTAVIALLLGAAPGWIALPLGFLLGFALIRKAQKRYNGGYFSS